MFEELVKEHGPDVDLRQSTGNSHVKYLCVRCGEVKQGPSFCVVVSGACEGVCNHCGELDEKKAALHFPLVEAKRRAGRKTVEADFRKQIVDSLLKQEGTLTQPCDRCGKDAIGGRVPSQTTNERLCTTCYNKELGELLKRG